MAALLGRLCRWLRRRPSYMLLAADEPGLGAEPPGRFARAWVGLTIQSLAWGMVLCGVWGLGWKTFRDFEPLIMPAVATLVVFMLWPFRRAAECLLEVACPREGRDRSIVAAVIVAAFAMCFMVLKPDFYRNEDQLPYWLDWIRPWAKLYRVLVLMPVWGAWSMLITPQFCRPTAVTEPYVAAMARRCGPLAAAACLAIPLAGSIFYFHYLGLRPQVTIAGAAALSAIAAGLICCRRTGGLTRRSLLAANLLTQLAFVVVYLANRR